MRTTGGVSESGWRHRLEWKPRGSMKPFYSPDRARPAQRPGVPNDSPVVVAGAQTVPLRARLAVYDTLSAAPRIYDVTAPDSAALIEQVSSRAYALAREAGGPIPYTVIREVVENLIHADFTEPVVSILDAGCELRFADQGPGIPDKERALLPGYTTATHDMKRFIRGVGSGLPLVREFLHLSGGSLEVTDNLVRGTVVTLSARKDSPAAPRQERTEAAPVSGSAVQEALSFDLRLTNRHQKVLSLVLEFGYAGPTLVSRELAVGLSTAHRDLAFLEELGLITSDDAGKRQLTELGEKYVETLFS